jgi:hypothetical protein
LGLVELVVSIVTRVQLEQLQGLIQFFLRLLLLVVVRVQVPQTTLMTQPAVVLVVEPQYHLA